MTGELHIAEVENRYVSAPQCAYWQVTRNPLRGVRDEAILSLVSGMQFRRVPDSACGLGVIASRLAQQAGSVLGLAGAPTAVPRTQALLGDRHSLRFRVDSLADAQQELQTGGYSLLVATGCFCYFGHCEQEVLLSGAARAGVPCLLLELRIVGRSGAPGGGFAEGCDYCHATAIGGLIRRSEYDTVATAVSRTYDLSAYSPSFGRLQRWAAHWTKRWLVDAPTAVSALSMRATDGHARDTVVLRRRLRLCSTLRCVPGLRWCLEPTVAGLALLCEVRSSAQRGAVCP